MYVISLASTLTQMVILIGSEDKESHINSVVMAALKKSETLVAKYFDQILVPSFRVEQTNAKYEVQGEIEDLKMEYAVQSAEIDLIAGLSANKGIKMNNSSQVQKVDEEFIFAINDQNLTKHKLNNTLLICSEVTKQHWNKI